jgi:hypothetical protein
MHCASSNSFRSADLKEVLEQQRSNFLAEFDPRCLICVIPFPQVLCFDLISYIRNWRAVVAACVCSFQVDS